MLSISPVTVDMRRWRLNNDVTVCLENGRCFRIPRGFITDFASVPRILWWLFPPMGRYGKAALVHDYLYYTKEVSRAEADRIFLEAMLMMGVGKLTAYTMYLAVRAFGWLRWRRWKRAEA